MTRTPASPAPRERVRRLITLFPLVPLVTIVVAAALWPPQLLAVMMAPGTVVMNAGLLVVIGGLLWSFVVVMRGRIRILDAVTAAAGAPVMYLLMLMALERHPVVSVVLVMSLVVLAARAALALLDSLPGITGPDADAPVTS